MSEGRDEKGKLPKWIDITLTQPNDSQICKIKTSSGRELEGVYYDEWGTFFLNNEDIELGWKDNGEQPELVTYWF